MGGTVCWVCVGSGASVVARVLGGWYVVVGGSCVVVGGW
ncbi:hypothetical protein PICSAR138_03969 [Mycobacterium avium subsp. paratuberculosis]|nr:hypothetical protein PICSAR138_03969 [Mycobacterium avium subsp. paratuberculosis]